MSTRWMESSASVLTTGAGNDMLQQYRAPVVNTDTEDYIHLVDIQGLVKAW